MAQGQPCKRTRPQRGEAQENETQAVPFFPNHVLGAELGCEAISLVNQELSLGLRQPSRFN